MKLGLQTIGRMHSDRSTSKQSPKDMKRQNDVQRAVQEIPWQSRQKLALTIEMCIITCNKYTLNPERLVYFRAVVLGVRSFRVAGREI